MAEKIRYITNDDNVIVGLTSDPGFGLHGIPYHGMGVYSTIVEEYDPNTPISETDEDGVVTKLFKDVNGVKTARTTEEKTDDPNGDALHLKNQAIVKIKADAQEEILEVAADWRQRNDLFDMVMLIKKVAIDAGSLTAEETTEMNDIIAKCTQINSIRAASDAAEAAL